MVKKMARLLATGIFLANMSGCFVLFAGAVGGAGTAVWLSGKLTQQVNASYERTVKATEKALRTMKLEIAKESQEADVTAFRSHYIDGKEIWIDVRRTTDTSTKVEIRVGGVSGDKEACTKILEKIKASL